jgi:hypothetical protein
MYWSIVLPAMAIIWPEGYHTQQSIIIYKCVLIFGLIFGALGLGSANLRNDANSEKIIENNEKTLTDINLKILKTPTINKKKKKIK